MRSTLSVLGIYNYDNTLFENFLLPDQVDKDTLVDGILTDTAELEVVYTDSDFLKEAIHMWSRRRLPVWVKLGSTLNYEYNPIENYDRRAEINDTYHEEGKHGVIVSSASTTEQNSEGKVAAYDTDELQTNTGGTATGSNTSSNKTDDEHIDEHTNAHDEYIHGNIGVTTTQQMIQQEREVSQFDLYQYIIDDFKKRFCLLVY